MKITIKSPNGSDTRVINLVSGFTQIAGGSITTEQIKDTLGRLIIDLSANPPTITAKDGAKVIGTFDFQDRIISNIVSLYPAESRYQRRGF